MTKSKILFGCLVILLTFFVSACSEDGGSLSPAPVSISGNEYTIESCSEYPMLSFATEEEFTSFMEQIVNLSDDELDLNPKLNNFLSERKFIDGLDNKSDEEVCSITNGGEIGSSDVEMIDPVLSSIVNPKHEIKIAGIIYEINNDFVYAYTDCQYKSDIIDFKANPNSRNIEYDEEQFVKLTDNVFIYKTNINYYDEVLSLQNDANVELRDAKRESKDYDSGKRRVKGKMFHSKWGVWTSLGVKTINYRKRCGIWWRSDAKTLRLSWDMSMIGDNITCDLCSNSCDIGDVIKWDGSKQGNDSSVERALFDWAVGFGVKLLTDGTVKGVKGAAKGAPIKILPHGAQGNVTKSDHSANTNCCGNVATNTIFEVIQNFVFEKKGSIMSDYNLFSK